MADGGATIKELVSQIDSGEIRLPEMQRGYVWKQTQVRDLLDSIYRKYPSGTILLWSVRKSTETPTREFAVGQSDAVPEHYKLLLDGQQRLTSLSSILQGKPVDVRGRKNPIDILFNLHHPDNLEIVTELDESEEETLFDGENFDDDDSIDGDLTDATPDEITSQFDKMTFVVSTKILANLPHWISLQEFFSSSSDNDFLIAAGYTDLKDPKCEKYSKRLAQLRNMAEYRYTVDILPGDKSYEEVTEIFVRVNSKGTKLKSSDLALAQITAKWQNSLSIFEEFQGQCKDKGFNFDIGFHIKNMISVATHQCKFNLVNSLSKDDLEKAWEKYKEAMEFTLNFLRNNVGLESPTLLSSPFIAILISYYGSHKRYEITVDEEQELRKWVLLANAKGRYSRGSTETLLDQDIKTIKDGGGIAGLFKNLVNQVGKLDISASEIESRKTNSAYFKCMFMAFQKLGATDWDSKLNINVDNAGAKHKIEFHHIFPRKFLNDNQITVAQKVNDIANLAFIGSATNKKISKKAPTEYMNLFENCKEMFNKQCIPHDKFDDKGNLIEENYYLKIENYEEFLAERRRLIANCLNEFLGQELPKKD